MPKFLQAQHKFSNTEHFYNIIFLSFLVFTEGISVVRESCFKTTGE